MTEEEAKTKWCPMIRHAINDTDNNACNRAAKDVNFISYTCITTNCMMWRWTEDTYLDKLNHFGYCGLGGKP